MFKPKCMDGKPIFLNAEGCLTPCCWTDPLKRKKPHYNGELEGMKELYDEELNINNVDSVSEILLTKKWIDFFKRLSEGKDIPAVCQRYCGTERLKDGTRKIEKF